MKRREPERHTSAKYNSFYLFYPQITYLIVEARKVQRAQKRTEHLRERARSQAEGRKKMGKQMTTHSVNWVRVASLQPKICRNIANINVSHSVPISRLLTRLAVEAMGPKVFQMEQFHMVSTENTARIHHRCQYTRTGAGVVTASISTQ